MKQSKIQTEMEGRQPNNNQYKWVRSDRNKIDPIGVRVTAVFGLHSMSAFSSFYNKNTLINNMVMFP